MIIFYNKTSGNIVGTIDGRVHSEQHLKMHVGGEENGRLVIGWEIVRNEPYVEQIESWETDERGQQQMVVKEVTRNNPIWEPNSKQKELFILLDKNPSLVYNYKVDIKSLFLVENA